MSVFISYARENQPFVRRVDNALRAAGRDAWVDWQGIPPTADWMAEIRAAIDAADAALFIISPEWVDSPICVQELEHAVQQGKRLLPVVWLEAPAARVPEALASLNWIWLRDVDDFDAGFAELLIALDTDLDWVRDHTRLLVRAQEWQDGAEEARLLRGRDLDEAERWLAQGSVHSDPAPVPLQATFIAQSRTAARRRQHLLFGAVSSALVVSGFLTAWALVERGNAVENAEKAEANKLTAEANAETARINEGIAKEQQTIAIAERTKAEERKRDAESARDAALRSAARARSNELATASRVSRDAGNSDLALMLAGAALRADITSQAARSSAFAALDSMSARYAVSGGRGRLESAAFLADGERIVTAAEDGTIRFWRAKDGARLQERGVGRLTSFAVSEDARLMAVGSDQDKVHVIRVEDGLTVHELPAANQHVASLKFSPDTQRLAVYDLHGQMTIWDLSGPRILYTLVPGSYLGAGSVSPDLKRVLEVVRGKAPRVVSVDDAKQAIELESVGGRLKESAFTSDGRWIVGTDDTQRVHVWKVSTGRWQTELHGISPGERLLAISPNGQWVFTMRPDRSVGVYDLPEGTLRGHLRGIEDSPRHTAFSRDGLLAAITLQNGRSLLFDVRRGELLSRFDGHGDAVVWVGFSPEGGQVITASWDGTARVWRAPHARLVRSIDAHSGEALQAVSKGERGALVTNGRDGYVRTWNLATGSLTHERRAEGSNRFSVVGPDGRTTFLTADGDSGVLWDAVLDRAIARIEQPRLKHAPVFSRDSRLLLTAGTDLRVWETGTGALRQRIESESIRDSSWFLAAFDDAGDHLGVVGRSLSVWRLDSGARLKWSQEPESPKERPGQRQILISDATNFHWLSVAGGEWRELPLRAASTDHGVAAKSNDGRWIAVSSDASVSLFAASDGAWRRSFKAHQQRVSHLEFSRDGHRLLTAGYDGSARVWDVTTGILLSDLSGQPAGIEHASFSNDESLVMTAAQDGTVRLWDVAFTKLQPAGLLSLIDTRLAALQRRWTLAECQTYFPSESRRRVPSCDGDVADVMTHLAKP